jgi:hypothetical protein
MRFVSLISMNINNETYERLTRANAVLLLVDHQVGLVAGSRYPEPQDLRKNVAGLTCASKILGVPIVATTTMSDGMFGPLFPELADLLKDQEIIDRTKVNLEHHELSKAEIKKRRVVLGTLPGKSIDQGRYNVGLEHTFNEGIKTFEIPVTTLP